MDSLQSILTAAQAAANGQDPEPLRPFDPIAWINEHRTAAVMIGLLIVGAALSIAGVTHIGQLPLWGFENKGRKGRR